MTFSKFHEFIPKSYLYLRSGYKFSTFKKDLLAGITVGIIALPLAMAFAIASNVSPERGLYTAIIAGFLISLLGGSRIQIGGPIGAFVIVVYGIIQRTGYEGLCLSMLVAAVLLLILGIFRIGSWIKYVPAPLITGFTTGIAVIIFSTQIKDFCGLQMGAPSADFIEKWTAYFKYLPTFDPMTLSLSAGTLGIILLIRRFMPGLPWGITAIILATIVCALLHVSVETIQSRFGEIPRSLPFPSLPNLSIPADKLKVIFIDGITIAFLGAIESLLSAVIGDGMIGGRHRSNCELIAQGFANFGSVLFGGIPATGAIARTAANVKTGAQTPVAGMVHALILFLILCFFAPIVSRIPLAALSAVLVIIAWDMSEVGHFARLLKAPRGDRLILLTAFLLTVFVDITAALSIGIILASFLFMKRMSQMSKAVSLTQVFQEKASDFPEKTDPEEGVAKLLCPEKSMILRPFASGSQAATIASTTPTPSGLAEEKGGEWTQKGDFNGRMSFAIPSQDISKKAMPKGVEVYEIQGPFFFGAANMLRDLLSSVTPTPKIFILRMRFVPMIDASGMYGIEEFSSQCKKHGIILLLSGVNEQIKQDLKKFGLIDAIGKQRIFPNIDATLAKAEELLSSTA